jgi:hypothetical protein
MNIPECGERKASSLLGEPMSPPEKRKRYTSFETYNALTIFCRFGL